MPTLQILPIAQRNGPVTQRLAIRVPIDLPDGCELVITMEQATCEDDTLSLDVVVEVSSDDVVWRQASHHVHHCHVVWGDNGLEGDDKVSFIVPQDGFHLAPHPAWVADNYVRITVTPTHACRFGMVFSY